MLAIAVTAAACSKSNSDVYAYIEDAKTKYVGSVQPIPQFEPYESFAYSAFDLRDPFTPNENIDDDATADANSLRPDSDRPREPLEAFPLDTLAMVGTLEQKNNYWGLITDPQNIVHRVQPGDYLGQNEGRITAISETDINLIEIIPDGIGGYIEREASIAVGNE